MNDRQKAALKRGARTLAAAVIASALAFVASPDMLDVVPEGYGPLVVAVVTPILTAVDKALRYSDDEAGSEGDATA